MRRFKMAKLNDFLILLCCILTLVAGQKGPLESTTLHIAERSSPALIYQFEKKDARSTTFVLAGETDGIIDILPSDGWLITKGSLDWEKRPVHTLQVKTVDSRGSVIEGPYTVTIIVDDINNNIPAFNQSEYYGQVREQSRPGIPFIKVSATDKDDPKTPNAQLVYKINRQIPDPAKVMFFQINNVTGEISTTINGTQHLKFGDKQYELLIEVSDLAANPFSDDASVYITISENLWKQPNPVTIKENSTSPHPYTITKVTWNDQSVIYELHQRDRLPRFPFAIDQHGNISVTEPLDREERDQYIFYALAKNYNGVAVARPLEIRVDVEDINDNPPVCPAAETIFEFQENEPIGTTIGVLKATDNDQQDLTNALLRYKILEQWPHTPSGDMFRINTLTGGVQLINADINVQRERQYRLKVQVSDEGMPSFSTDCWVVINIIDINDNIPIFETPNYGNVTFPEDVAEKTLVKEIQATDADEPKTGSSAILYTIVEGDPDNRFIIETDPETNRGYIKVSASLDFETCKEHNLVINATNPEPLVTGVTYNSSSSTFLKVIVTDVDERPIFRNPIYQAQVLENAPIGTSLIQIEAFDPEGDKIWFSLKGNKYNWLKINEETGVIYSDAIMDRERQAHYTVDVVATESRNPKMSSSVFFHLYLDDVNDNYPRLAKDYYGDFSFCDPLTKPESFEFSAVDDDQPPHGTALKFRLGGDASTVNDWNIQYVNSTTARLIMMHSSFPKGDISVPVIIRDNGRPALEANVSVPVRICTCVSPNKCESTPLEHAPFSTVGMAVGILFGTLALIGIIVGAVLISINKKKKKASAGDANNAAETATLRS
ncbi:cadherin-17 [Dendropsophus ebraccatus]|uniref:cadherin-17 n=1 Tax=Dendropsophus ebraccatus TaxID=150705 RepID=UPI0038312229